LGHLVATASRYGGYLQGWVDFNGDDDFDDVGERIITNALLLPGDNDVYFDIPETMLASEVFARFRYGEFGIDSVTGAALIGEVEDYKLERAAPAVVLLNGPDFDADGDVDGIDFLSWQRGFGMSGVAVLSSNGDTNNDDLVNNTDLANWGAEFGSADPGGAPLAANAPLTATAEEESFNGLEFLSWQANFDSLAESSAPIAAATAPVESEVSDLPLAATASTSPSTEMPLAARAAVVPEVLATRSTVASAPVVLASVETTLAPSLVEQTSPANLAGDNGQGSARQVALASLANRLNSAEDFGLTRFDSRHGLSRLENQLNEFRLDRSADVEELGREVQDRVLDRLAARRQRPTDIPVEPHRRDEVSEEALSVALGEEIDWRFF